MRFYFNGRSGSLSIFNPCIHNLGYPNYQLIYAQLLTWVSPIPIQCFPKPYARLPQSRQSHKNFKIVLSTWDHRQYKECKKTWNFCFYRIWLSIIVFCQYPKTWQNFTMADARFCVIYLQVMTGRAWALDRCQPSSIPHTVCGLTSVIHACMGGVDN